MTASVRPPERPREKLAKGVAKVVHMMMANRSDRRSSNLLGEQAREAASLL
jgi:hypothetical protein